MNRPHVIVHTVASADGRVSLGVNRTGFEDVADPRWQAIWSSDVTLEESVRNLVALHKPQVMLEGSGSFAKEGEGLQPLPPAEDDPARLYEDYLPDAVVCAPGRCGWFAAVDGRGRLRAGMKEFPGWDGWHTLHLVSHGAPPEYLAHLQRLEIPYLIAGRKHVHLKAVLEKMKARLGVDRVVCTAGSRLNGALLRAGLVDEISLVLLPAVIGGTRTPTLFRSPDLGPDAWPARLKLLSATGEPGGRVCLRYEVLAGREPE
ncbi:MAG: RibD family protein [Kiritimatiellae bacterium]|nr:RibD family protein [Kiritimatiellia bacterium]